MKRKCASSPSKTSPESGVKRRKLNSPTLSPSFPAPIESPPQRKRLSLLHSPQACHLASYPPRIKFQSHLTSLSGCVAHDVLFEEITGSEFLPLDIREMLCDGTVRKLRVVDLGNQLIHKIYQKPDGFVETKHSDPSRDSQEERSPQKRSSRDTVWNNVPVFRVTGLSEHSRLVLCFLSGVLVRKGEAAIVPLNSDYNLFLFAQKCSAGEIPTELTAILVRRFNLIFDLDFTLIKARPAENCEKLAQEHEFTVSERKFYCAIREGTDQLMRWATEVFKVRIFTNAVFEYALEVCKLIDPHQKTLLRGINLQNEYEVKNIIKSRELFPSPSCPGVIESPSRQKDFDHFGLNPFETVILDDDSTVWTTSSQQNLLPYKRIHGAQNFFHRVREEIWSLFDVLHAKKLRLMMEKLKTEGKRALYDEGSAIVVFNHSLESNAPTSSFDDYESNSDFSEDDEDRDDGSTSRRLF